MFEDGEGDVIYLDKGVDKVIINFVQIEITCLNYCSSFPQNQSYTSTSKLVA